ncbi:MAG: SurA N-terminal domain-containing protein [Thermodesulfobacteriota bacterium]|nr:SurA N-terminal domain-containing protein [Thermodesulfobacteriota bacterium]
MLTVLRKHATSWMLKGLLLLVAVTFISWGGYSFFRDKKYDYAATVNGAAIHIKDYQETLRGVMKRYQDAMGPALTDKMIEELRIRENVLEELISRTLILQEGKRLGLNVPDGELRMAIESIPSFQINGQFDSRLYERFLRLNRLNPEDFETMQRESLLYSKVVNLIRLNGGKVSEEEVLEAYLFENEKVNLHFVKIAPEAFRGQVSADEVEIKDYFQKHQEEFRIPAYLQVQYLAFRPSDVEPKIQISPDEIKRYYDQRKESFKVSKQVRAREILIRVEPQDPPDRMEEKKKKAEEILGKARKTKDFASLAKQYSESGTAQKGGDLGWLQKGNIDESFEKVLFSLKAGDLSNVVRGGDGFYIFKAEEVTEEKQKPFEEVKDQIHQAFKKDKAKAEASRRADDAFYSLFRSRDIETFAREKDVPIKTTGFFKEGDEIPGIGKDPSFHSSALSLKTGEISPVVSIPPNFFILKLVDKKESRIPPLEEVKEEVIRKVAGKKTEEKARQTAEEILNQMKSGKEIREVLRGKGYSLEETGLFSRTGGVIPKIGPAGEWMASLSSLTEKQPLPKEVFRTKEGYFVVRLLSSEPADPNKFQSVKKNLEKRLTYQKQEEFFRNWLQHLRSKAKVEINKDVL